MTPVLVKRISRFFSRRENALAFEQVADPRKRRGRRWSLHSLLTATFLGMSAMHKDFRGVERLTRNLRGCRKRFRIPRRVPDSTLARVFSKLRDEKGLRRCLIEDIRRAHRRKALAPVRAPIHVVAIDGKTIWCSRKRVDDPACQAMHQDGGTYYRLHTLHAVLASAASQPCIDQMLVPARTNEMGALPSFVKQLKSAYGDSLIEVLSMDAGMTSSDNAQVISQAGFRYVMALKNTQPTLLEETKRLCGWGEHKQSGYVCAATTPWQRYRGKRVRRQLYRSKDIRGWPGWQSAHQVWRVKQTTEDANGRREVENRFFITSLPWDRLTGEQILDLVRLHWAVENGCHWTLDVVMGQDRRPWCTKGRALRMLSWVRLMAYNAVRFLRDRYLRSERHRSMPWADLSNLIEQTFCQAMPWQKDPTAEATQATL